MKKIFFILSIFGLVIFAMNSCTDEDLNPLNDLKQGGGFLYFEDPMDAVIGTNTVADLVFQGTLVDPTGNVVSYEYFVYGVLSGVRTDTADFGPYTSFPLEINFTAADFVSALDSISSVADIDFGDAFFFEGTVTNKDGEVYYAEEPEIEEVIEGNDTSIVYVPNGQTRFETFDPNSGYRDCFLFDFAIGCPGDSYEQSGMAGTWTTTVSDFYIPAAASIVIETGTTENQFTMKDVFGAGYDLVVDVDPSDNVCTVAYQSAADDWFGYGLGSVQGTGTMFYCAGFFSLSLEHTVGAGSFGSFTLKLSK